MIELTEENLRRVIREELESIHEKLDKQFEGVNHSFSLVIADIEKIEKSLSEVTYIVMDSPKEKVVEPEEKRKKSAEGN